MKLPDLFGDHKDDSKKEETVADKNVVNESSPENNAISENQPVPPLEVPQNDVNADDNPGIVPTPNTENDLGVPQALNEPENLQDKTGGENSENVANIEDVRAKLDDATGDVQNSKLKGDGNSNNSEVGGVGSQDVSKVVDFQRPNTEQDEVTGNNELLPTAENDINQLFEKVEQGKKEIDDLQEEINAKEEEINGYISEIKAEIDKREQEHAKKGEELDNIRNHPALGGDGNSKTSESEDLDLAA